MYKPWRPAFARAFQQAVRLRRRTGTAGNLFAQTPVSNDIRSFATQRPRRNPTLKTAEEGSLRYLRSLQYKLIAVPEIHSDIESWIEALDVALPPYLRTVLVDDTEDYARYTSWSISSHILYAYATESKHELLTHLGVVHGRWDAVIWIVNRLIEQGDPIETTISTATSPPLFSWLATKSMDVLTEEKSSTEELFLQNRGQSLHHALNYTPRISNQGWTSHKGTLGLVWRTIGSMILASVRGGQEESERIMPYALQLLAILHHNDIIPDTVYKFAPASDPFAPHQPPLLHLLSTNILTSLSDAAWSAQESSNAIRSKATGAEYDFLGRAMPGFALRSQIPQIGNEVWLELILWCCLHGGWVVEGASILRDTQAQSEDSPWSLIAQTPKLTKVEERQWNLNTKPIYRLLGRFRDTADDANRTIVANTISSEVVAAFVDGLLNSIRLGVGERGVAASVVLEHIQHFKRMLDKHDMGLGAMSWDAVVIRFLESGGVNAEANPRLLQNILALAQPFAREVKLENTPVNDKASGGHAPYMFDPSAASLGLLHYTIRAFINRGDASGALHAFQQLQDLTDRNKNAAIREFFEYLQDVSAASGSSSEDKSRTAIESGAEIAESTSNTAELAVAYPSFHPQVPARILARLLDLCTKSEAFDFGRWLLYSKDIDGALIPEERYADWVFAPSLIRFGTATRDRDLLSRVIQVHSKTGPEQRGRALLDGRLLNVFLQSQVELRRWDGVENTLALMGSRPEEAWGVPTLVRFAKELLRMEGERLVKNRVSSVDSKASVIFNKLFQSFYGNARQNWADMAFRMNTILAFLSSLGPDWERFCRPMRRRAGPHPCRLSTSLFNELLEGVVGCYGSLKSRQICDIWCIPASASNLNYDRYRPGHDYGTKRMDPVEPSRGRDFNVEMGMITVPRWSEDDIPYVLYDRISPDVNTVRIIVKAAIAETEGLDWEEMDAAQDRYRELARWAIKMLKSLGLDDENITGEMSLLKIR